MASQLHPALEQCCASAIDPIIALAGLGNCRKCLHCAATYLVDQNPTYTIARCLVLSMRKDLSLWPSITEIHQQLIC